MIEWGVCAGESESGVQECVLGVCARDGCGMCTCVLSVSCVGVF